MNYQLYTRVYDGGQVVTKIIVECDSLINSENISLNQFEVFVTRSLNGVQLDGAKRRIISTYTSSSINGRPSEKGRYLHLVLLT